MRPTFIADKSALARLAHPSVDRRLTPLMLAGDVASCAIIDLELLYSARTHKDFTTILRDREALPALDVGQEVFDRAIAVMERLSRRGEHRGVSIPDLLIAAVAERAGLTVLHYDHDFDLIASVTRQSVEWIVEPGSVP
jgi:hypothetical protein